MSIDLSNAGRSLLDRRSFLGGSLSGLASIALAQLLKTDRLLAGEAPTQPLANPLAPRPPHFASKAKQVLVIFCSGALSHLDSFDYKPQLIARHGQRLPGGDKLITFQGEQGMITRSPWDFRPRGRCGKQTSDLLPHLGDLADDLCFIHSMTAKSNTHGPAENQMGTGFTLEGFPSMGAWVSYALGSASQDLPAFVAIPDPRGIPQTGPAQWSAGFLPGVYQGTPFNAARPIPHLARPAAISANSESASRDFLKLLNDQHLARHPGDADLAARIASYELSARMQLSAAAVGDLATESPATLDAYGANDPDKLKAGFARNCILARRLLERGVRFVQLFNGAYAMGEGVGNWDGHRSLQSQYSVHAPILYQPAAALICDLKSRGLLDETLVLFTTEFGRMPTFQKGASGRDHNPKGFTVFLAGAGVKPGYSHGATDDFGYQAVQDVATIYDLHATLLHLLGLNHEKLTYYHNGIQRRLTDVHGHVIRPILA
jgi:hypothetical protein